MIRRFSPALVLAAAALVAFPAISSAAISSQNSIPPLPADPGSSADHILARTNRIIDSIIANQRAFRQIVTTWAVSDGNWNGENLAGLSLVLIQDLPESGPNRGNPITHCYFSHLATPSQRDALLNAFLTAMNLPPRQSTTWTIEPAVIRLEPAGHTTILHLATIS